MASPAFSFCAAVENSVQMLFIEIETDPYTATRLAGNDLEICKLTYGTRKELFHGMSNSLLFFRSADL